jgi:hypothetical protein
MTNYIVATVRSAEWRTVEVGAVDEKKWDAAKVDGMITSIWRVSGCATKAQAIAAVVENAVGIGNTTAIVRPQKRDRSYLLNVLGKIARLTFDNRPAEADWKMMVEEVGLMAREGIIDAEAMRSEARDVHP